MILKSLKVKNLRSIKDLDLELPQSTMLFHGDIGSGKSSVLKAIEFALFGTLKAGDLEGASLLRRGEKLAEAELTFLIDGKKYTIHRELKSKVRGGEVIISQPTGWLIEGGEKTKYTTTELRRKILAILNYSVSRYDRKGSIDIFRYTVYTPQEEIKKILEAKAKERFEILKDVLEIEKYENTLRNLNTIKTNLNSMIRDRERDIKNLGSPEEEIPKQEEQIKSKGSEIKEIKEKIGTKEEKLQKENTILDVLRKELSDYSTKITEIKTSEKQIKKDTDSVKKNQDQLTKIQEELKPLKDKLENLPEIKLETDQSEKQLEKSLKKLRRKGTGIVKDRAKIDEKIKNVKSLLMKGICALCGQIIHEKERFDKELQEAENTLQRFTEEITHLDKEITTTEGYKDNVRKYSDNEKEKKRITELINGNKKREVVIKTVLSELEKNIKESEQNIEDILKLYNIADFNEFKELDQEFSQKVKEQKSNVDAIQKQIIDLEKTVSSLETEFKGLKEDLKQLRKDLERKRQLEKNINYISNVRDWVADKFPILLKDIERMVLRATALHFNRYFKEWFQVMVEEENIDVQVNPENFDPHIVVNGYESPAGDLSGGEKSALSLAYRLALNKVINTKHQEVKTKDLLILDEPTDGFSQQQINKMQDIFERLDTKQMIIISHERTLDSFVTDIFNFAKQNHVTKVTREE
ncbi:MAG: AAA family ATPase [Candidatus Hodarchaeales archaeon]|jgi:exonuclease SbcC